MILPSFLRLYKSVVTNNTTASSMDNISTGLPGLPGLPGLLDDFNDVQLTPIGRPPTRRLGVDPIANDGSSPSDSGLSTPASQTANNSVLPPTDSTNAFLVDPSNYLPQETFFQLVQDKGIPMSPEDMNNSKSKKRKYYKSTETWYKDIHELGTNLYDLYIKQSAIFPNLGKNKSIQVKKICKWLLQKRLLVARADIHRIVDPTVLPFVQTSNPEITHFYILGQIDILKMAIGDWCGETLKDKQKPTDNDRIRVMGILFQEDFREDISLLLDKARSSREGVDNPRMQQRAIYHRVLNEFNDPDVIIEHPPSWIRDITKEKIGQLEWSKYNPNDNARIAIPRTSKQMTHIYLQVMSDYKTMMELYTKGTGGGSGDPADYSDWEQREDTTILRYHNNSTSQYLTWVFMYDKQYEFILTKRLGPLPVGTRLDDGNVREEGGCSAGRITPSAAALGDELRQAREESARRGAEMTNMLSTLLKGETTDPSNEIPILPSRSSAEVLKEINQLMVTIKTCKADHGTAIGRKRRITVGDTQQTGERKKLKKDIKRLTTTIDTLEVSLDCCLNELRVINGKAGGPESNSSGDDSSSSEED